MTFDESDAALVALGWKIADFCRATERHRNTPQRWKREGIAIPGCAQAFGPAVGAATPARCLLGAASGGPWW